MSTLDALIELQAIDVRLTQLEHRLATLPERQQQTDLDAAIASVDERIGVVEKDAEEEAAVTGPLERARARGVPAASQDWLRNCLLQQKLLELTDHPPTLKLAR